METRRSRASTTIEPPSSWGGLFKKTSPPSSPSSNPSPPSTAPPPLSLSSRTTSMATMRPALASSDPLHRRAASSLTSSVDSSSLRTLSIPQSHAPSRISDSGSASSPLLSTSVPSPRSTMPASAFAGLQLPSTKSSKGKGFTQTIVEFIRSPRTATPKVVTTPAPSPYITPSNVNLDTAIFGVELETAVRRSNRIHELLPDVVYKCMIYLHDKGPQEEGIFRLTGSVAEIKKIREVYDEGKDYDINACLNPHTVAGVLKLFIRESPQRLIPTSWSWSEVRPMQELHDMVKQLAPPNRCFLSCLIRLLRIVSLASDVTKMGISNLVIVFSAALQCTGSFLTHLINHAADLFPIDELIQTRQRTEAEKKVKEEKEKEEKAEQSRIDSALKERAEKEKTEKERAEKEKIEKEKIERERAEKERADEERKRAERERAQTEREEKARADEESAEKDRAEKERAEKEHIEKSRIERELAEKERLEGETEDRERAEYTEKRVEDKYTIRAKLDRKKQREHDHKKKEKRDMEKKRDKKGKEENKRDKDAPLFEDEKELEQENTWISHMEQYEKEEEQRKLNRETKKKQKDAINEKTEKIEQSEKNDDLFEGENMNVAERKTREEQEDTGGKDRNVGKDIEQTKKESDVPKTLTVEIRNQASLYDEDDIFKQEDEKKGWELDIGDRREESVTEKRKVKKRLQTIFDSDDDE